MEKQTDKEKLFAPKCNFVKNRWYVFYGDEDGDKYNRGFENEKQARIFCVEVALNGGMVYDIYYE